MALTATADGAPDAFAAALLSLQCLDPCDPLRAKMQSLLDSVEPQLQRPRTSRGRRPTLSEARINKRNSLHRLNLTDPRRLPRSSAFAAIEALLEMGWPPMSSTERTEKQRSISNKKRPRGARDKKRPRGAHGMQPPVYPPLPMLPSLENRVREKTELPLLRRRRHKPPEHEDDGADDDEDDAWCCDVRHAGCIKQQVESPEPAHAYKVWSCERCNWCACEACCAVGAHALCDHELELTDQDGDFVCNAWSNPRRREWPDGAVEHYEGERGVERLVSIVYPDGHIEDYEGEKDAERKVCVEWPDGPLEHYEGERGAERLVRMEWPDGQVDHYEGERDAEQTVRVERPSDDATIMSESYV